MDRLGEGEKEPFVDCSTLKEDQQHQQQREQHNLTCHSPYDENICNTTTNEEGRTAASVSEAVPSRLGQCWMFDESVFTAGNVQGGLQVFSTDNVYTIYDKFVFITYAVAVCAYRMCSMIFRPGISNSQLHIFMAFIVLSQLSSKICPHYRGYTGGNQCLCVRIEQECSCGAGDDQ